MITAGGPKQEAMEGPEWGHSVFTYYLLEGLNKGTADLNSDGIIPTSELYTYLDERVFSAAQMKGHTQRPVMWTMAAEKGEFVFFTTATGKTKAISTTPQISGVSTDDMTAMKQRLAEMEQKLAEQAKTTQTPKPIEEARARPYDAKRQTLTKVSSPVKGRVQEVRAKLGDRVRAGDVLLVIDSPDITAAYSDFVKEKSELEYATRAFELAKDLYESEALPSKDFKQAENDLVRAREEFQHAKERMLSLRVPAEELDKPLAEQKVSSQYMLKSPSTGTVVERDISPGQTVSGDPSRGLFAIAPSE